MRQLPNKNKEYVISLCKFICPKSQCIYVSVKPLPNKPPNECFSIVPEHIASNGGKQKFGWSIWHWPHILVEAEFHSIWERPNGTLVDITPKDFPVDKILFLPDPKRLYEGRQVDNIRRPISHDPLIQELIALMHEKFREMNKGNLASQKGYILPSPRVNEIKNKMAQIYFMIHEKLRIP